MSRPICAVLLPPASRTLVGSQKLRAIHSCRRSFSLLRNGPPALACRRCLHGWRLTFQILAVSTIATVLGSCVATLAHCSRPCWKQPSTVEISSAYAQMPKSIVKNKQSIFPIVKVNRKIHNPYKQGKKRHHSMESLGVPL
ncbi:hypothetical protein [Delftia acidovorans]|uniref:hypothetical protein n=1 Tax=Delftia acidovorans TaxID=80866 RepID=UPI0035A0DDEF